MTCACSYLQSRTVFGFQTHFFPNRAEPLEPLARKRPARYQASSPVRLAWYSWGHSTNCAKRVVRTRSHRST